MTVDIMLHAGYISCPLPSHN